VKINWCEWNTRKPGNWTDKKRHMNMRQHMTVHRTTHTEETTWHKHDMIKLDQTPCMGLFEQCMRCTAKKDPGPGDTTSPAQKLNENCPQKHVSKNIENGVKSCTRGEKLDEVTKCDRNTPPYKRREKRGGGNCICKLVPEKSKKTGWPLHATPVFKRE